MSRPGISQQSGMLPPLVAQSSPDDSRREPRAGDVALSGR